MPIIDKSRDMGTVVMGKIESGSVRRGDSLIVMPNKVSEFFRWRQLSGLVGIWMLVLDLFSYRLICFTGQFSGEGHTGLDHDWICMQALVKVVTVYRDNDEVNYAKPGENLRIRIAGVEEEDISPGFVLSSVSKYPISYLNHFMVFEICFVHMRVFVYLLASWTTSILFADNPIPAVLEFDAQLQILELLDHKVGFLSFLLLLSSLSFFIYRLSDGLGLPMMACFYEFVKNSWIWLSQIVCLERHLDFCLLCSC